MGRGPSYPYVNLSEAVELSRKVYDFTRKSAAPLGSVIKDAWQYSPTSSSGEKVLAALKSFGLLEESASGDAKVVKISDKAYRILVDEQGSPERLKALREAALSPKWYRFCWDTWGIEMPPSMRSSLLFEHGFVESTVDKFIQDYKDTVQFAKIIDGEKDPVTQTDSNPESATGPKIGDSVQWESQGVLQFSEPKRVREISDDGEWAFLEGSNTGVPMKELAVVAIPTGRADPKLPPKPKSVLEMRPPPSAFRQDVFSLPEGTVTIQWPSDISAESFQDMTDWLKLLERKIRRSIPTTGKNTYPALNNQHGDEQ